MIAINETYFMCFVTDIPRIGAAQSSNASTDANINTGERRAIDSNTSPNFISGTRHKIVLFFIRNFTGLR